MPTNKHLLDDQINKVLEEIGLAVVESKAKGCTYEINPMEYQLSIKEK